MFDCFLTIDNGLSKSKAALIDLNGREIASSVIKSDVINKGNYSEINMLDQWENTVYVIKKVIKTSKIHKNNIIAVGNTAHGAGLYMINKNGQPVRNAFSSMDKRGIDILNNWETEGKDNYDKTYQHMWNGQPIPYLYWIKENEPENYNNIYKILMAKDWIKFKLTDNIFTDYTDASNSGLLNPETKKYDIDILKPFNLEEVYGKLPDIIGSSKIIGEVSKKAAKETGLKVGTPVVNGMFDVAASAVGSGVYKENRYCLISGTWNINAGVVKDIKPNANIMTWSVYTDQNRYLCFDASPTATVNLEWYIDNIIRKFGFDILNTTELYQKIEKKMIKMDPKNVNIIFTPFIYKSTLSKKMDGTFFGIKSFNDSYDLIRAIHEGIVFAHFKHIEKLREGGINRNKAVLSGGVTNSSFWCQLFADILNMDIIISNATQIGALGSAITAGIGIDKFKNFEEGIKKMVTERKRFYPCQNRNLIYRERYKKFKSIIDIIEENL